MKRLGPVVFLDRDGTLNRNYEDGPVYQIERFELLARAAEAVRLLRDADLPVYVVTNQGGIRHEGRDFDQQRYEQIEQKMFSQLQQQAQTTVDAVYVCPHADYEGCSCRKPKVGLFEKAYQDHPFDSARSFIAGDAAADIRAGNAFGLRTILVQSGWRQDVLVHLAADGIRPDHVVADVYEAARLIRDEVLSDGKE